MAKNKTRNLEIPARAHNIIVHNLSYNFDVCLDKRIIKFVYNALNLSNEICHNLLHMKLKNINTSYININSQTEIGIMI